MIKKLKQSRYKVGDYRVKLKFAWFPIKIKSFETTYLVWFEYYYSHQELRRWFDNTTGTQGIYWREIKKNLYDY